MKPYVEYYCINVNVFKTSDNVENTFTRNNRKKGERVKIFE